MVLQGNIDLHFWIARAMARKMGANFSDAMHDGLLSHVDCTDIITRCRTCNAAQDCLAYLSEIGLRAPHGCCNADVLGELAALQAS